jgi:hypothetical protein
MRADPKGDYLTSFINIHCCPVNPLSHHEKIVKVFYSLG